MYDLRYTIPMLWVFEDPFICTVGPIKRKLHPPTPQKKGGGGQIPTTYGLWRTQGWRTVKVKWNRSILLSPRSIVPQPDPHCCPPGPTLTQINYDSSLTLTQTLTLMVVVTSDLYRCLLSGLGRIFKIKAYPCLQAWTSDPSFLCCLP